MNPHLSVAYTRFQQLIDDAVGLLPGLGLGLLVLLAFLFGAHWTRRLVEHANAPRYHQNLVLVFGRLAQSGIVLIGALLAVTIAFPSFTPAKLIGALGVTGIAIGFAFKDIFENFLAGILILMTEPFRIDDQIVFGAYEGTVERIETRATMLRTYDGRLAVIPNSELYKSSFIVNTASVSRRIERDVTIDSTADIAAAKATILAVLQRIAGIERTPVPDVLVMDLADFGVKLRLRWWIQPPRRADALALADQVLSEVKLALASAGIDLPFPTYRVLLHDQTADADQAGRTAGSNSPSAAPGQIQGGDTAVGQSG